MAFDIDSLWKGGMGRLLQGEGENDIQIIMFSTWSASLLQELPQFQHDGSTYRGARLIHWLVLQRDVAGMRERQEELRQCRDLTCTRQDEMGDTKEVN